YFSVNILVVFPICVSILYLGLQQRKGLAKISHSDAFTFHVAAVQIVNVLSSLVTVIGVHFCDSLVLAGNYMFFVCSSVLLAFQCLTCGERYVAVVHPLTYLRLKKNILARNIICGLVWLLCVFQALSGSFVNTTSLEFVSVYVGIASVLVYILFCNVSVLAVLLRPRPGDGARKNQSTKRAFCTISTILGTLMLRGLGDIMGSVFIVSEEYSAEIRCGLWTSVAWLSFPCNLI
ncbi:hypothetical protein NQD34_013449, partial [Periophthalmus magnuspinnatus]